MFYTLGQAAKATGISKPTLSRAIKSGRISGQKQPDGSFLIDPAELHRVYPPVSVTDNDNGSLKQSETQSNPNALQAQLDVLREERERERQQLQATIDDLRERLDKEAEERRRLTLMLTHQPEPKADPTPAPATEAAPVVRPAVWLAATVTLAAVVAWLLWLHYWSG